VALDEGRASAAERTVTVEYEYRPHSSIVRRLGAGHRRRVGDPPHTPLGGAVEWLTAESLLCGVPEHPYRTIERSAHDDEEPDRDRVR